jgi:head-tail adaptor
MSYDSLLRHTVVIERATDGPVDEYNTPSQVWAQLAVVPALIQPRSARERIQLNEAGAVAADYRVFMRPTDILESDHLICQDPGAEGIYEISFVADAGGQARSLELECSRVYP